MTNEKYRKAGELLEIQAHLENAIDTLLERDCSIRIAYSCKDSQGFNHGYDVRIDAIHNQRILEALQIILTEYENTFKEL